MTKTQPKFYMGIAFEISYASHATRSKVGCVIVKEDNIIGFGYNGTPRGFDNTCEVDGVTKQEVLHAESNAISKCSQSTLSSKGADLYTTSSPCPECCKLIIQAGIARVFYTDEYHNQDGLIWLQQAGIKYIKVEL